MTYKPNLARCYAISILAYAAAQLCLYLSKEIFGTYYVFNANNVFFLILALTFIPYSMRSSLRISRKNSGDLHFKSGTRVNIVKANELKQVVITSSTFNYTIKAAGVKIFNLPKLVVAEKDLSIIARLIV